MKKITTQIKKLFLKPPATLVTAVPCLVLTGLLLLTVCSLYEGDIQVIADVAGDNDRRNVNPTNIGPDAVTNTGKT